MDQKGVFLIPLAGVAVMGVVLAVLYPGPVSAVVGVLALAFAVLTWVLRRHD